MGEILANFLANYWKNSQLVENITTVLESYDCIIVYLYLVARQPLSSVRCTALPEEHHVEVGYFGPSRLPSSANPQGSPGSVRKHPLTSIE
ncbi:hypothetical protein TNIN_358621 [Trichonephila inaurata madagascariensis]|uniref:Uncharacterized protein n=1 Tax=Trichonephila inaurata madagascariensis TaxID=2747483 RepID=A0A8X6JQT8_9ARAC|nr:hypothetical protein TNIN_358621 [Trichonephila inaurata madagascariensis]